jgi:predicted transcriptional regulator
MDFRLEEETKKLVEIAAKLTDMTVSGYMNHLVNKCKDKILDDIGEGLAEITMVNSLVDLGALGIKDVNEIAAMVRSKFVLSVLESENNEFRESFFNNKEEWRKVVKSWAAEYYKENKEQDTLSDETK